MGNGVEYDEELGKGFIRIAYAFPKTMLMDALQKLKAAVDKRKGE